MKEDITWRMYGLVPYNISEIQKGIQFGHGVVEYAQNCFNDNDYQKWAQEHKTFIILNGGTSSTMVEHMETLHVNGIDLAGFKEPDLNDMLSAVVFLVDSRVYDRENYPDFYTYCLKIKGGDLPTLMDEREMSDFLEVSKETSTPTYMEWVTFMGGEKNIFLRDYLSKLRLA